MDKKRSSDFLSDLPLGTIVDILWLLPTKDAVRTSILSRKWRFIWCSLPRLAFTNEHKEDDGDLQRLFHFIDRALRVHEGPLHEFKLSLPKANMSAAQCQLVDQWLVFLSGNHIRIVDIRIDYCYYDVHPSLYSCQYLTNLELCVPTIPPPPPSFKGFMFLRSLHINAEEVDSSTIESIVALSPLLEDLRLDCIYFEEEMTICAPNLKYLYFSSVAGSLTLSTPLLHDLNGSFEEITGFSIGVESSVFHHLTTIKLSNVPFDNKEVTPAVIRLIKCSPNLEELKISDSSEYDEAEPNFLWDSESAPNFTYNSLKVIEMNTYSCNMYDMKLLEFLLARSRVLETLIYKPSRILSETVLLNRRTQLLGYYRASANAQIVIG